MIKFSSPPLPSLRPYSLASSNIFYLHNRLLKRYQYPSPPPGPQCSVCLITQGCSFLHVTSQFLLSLHSTSLLYTEGAFLPHPFPPYASSPLLWSCHGGRPCEVPPREETCPGSADCCSRGQTSTRGMFIFIR